MEKENVKNSARKEKVSNSTHRKTQKTQRKMRQMKMPIELVYLNEMCSIYSNNNYDVESDETKKKKKECTFNFKICK